jgi:hypothetical protein
MTIRATSNYIVVKVFGLLTYRSIGLQRVLRVSLKTIFANPFVLQDPVFFDKV